MPTVLIEFHDDDGITINTQIITSEALAHLPLVVLVTLTAMRLGAKAAEKLLRVVRLAEELEDAQA